MTIARSTAMLAVATLIAGCNGSTKPSGSVVAKVDGQDITTGDLEAEARARGIRFDTPDGAAARKAVTKFVVSRAMLVADAKQAHLDNDPRILAERRRVDAGVLAQAQVAKIMASAPPLTPQRIDAYRAANPQMFARRQALTVNEVQVKLNGPLPAGDRSTLEALVAQVSALGLPVQQGRTEIDSAALTAPVFEALLAHPTTPARLDAGGPVATFATLVSARPNPAPEAAQRETAARLLQGQWLDKSIEASVARRQKEGKLSYEPGYKP